MRATCLILLGMVAAMLSAAPLRFKDNRPTDYNYYLNKYDELWELADSSALGSDTTYVYRLGGQRFAFNQDGKKLK